MKSYLSEVFRVLSGWIRSTAVALAVTGGLALPAGAGSFPAAVDGVVTINVASGTTTYDVALPASTTKLVKTGAGEAKITADSTAAKCPVEIQGGTVTITTLKAFGSTVSTAGDITVCDGATLKINATPGGQSTLGISRPVHISGTGVDGAGAVVYNKPSGASDSYSDSLLAKLVLDADATISAPNRWGLREIVFNGHTLARVGGANFMLFNTVVQPGHFVNTAGTLTIQGTSFKGTVEDGLLTMKGGSLDLWNTANPIPVHTVFSGGSFSVGSYGSNPPTRTSTNNRFTGSVELTANTRTKAKLLNVAGKISNASCTFYVGDNSALSTVIFRDGAHSPNLSLAMNDLAQVDIHGGSITCNMIRVSNGGSAASPKRGVIRQTGGYLSDSEWDQLHVGEATGTYGAYVLEGGTVEVKNNSSHEACFVAKSESDVDNRKSVGLLVQKGGLWRHTGPGTSTYNSLSIGRKGYGYCVVSGGTNDTFCAKDQSRRTTLAIYNGWGALDVSGSNTLYRTCSVDLGGTQSTNYHAYLSVRDGATLTADRFRVYHTAAGVTPGHGEIYFDGGILMPTYFSGFTGLSAGTATFHDRDPAHFVIGSKGMVVDTSLCYANTGRTDIGDAIFAFALEKPTGKGIASITLPAMTGTYLGPLPLYIEGPGHGAVAYVDYDFDAKKFTPVILSPGCDYDETTKVYLPSATVLDGSSGAQECAYTLADNATTGGLVKRGAKALILYGACTYGGPTVVEAGTLTASVAGAIPNGNDLVVRKGATLSLVSDLSVGTLQGQGTIKGGNVTCTNFVLNLVDAYASGATPLTCARKLTFADGAKVEALDPNNFETYENGGTVALARATEDIEGTPTLVLPEGVSSAWHVYKKNGELLLTRTLSTTIVFR